MTPHLNGLKLQKIFVELLARILCSIDFSSSLLIHKNLDELFAMKLAKFGRLVPSARIHPGFAGQRSQSELCFRPKKKFSNEKNQLRFNELNEY
jgi:hypothetical protein